MALQVDIYTGIDELGVLQNDWARLCKFKEAGILNYCNRIKFTPQILSPYVVVAKDNEEIIALWAGWTEKSTFREQPFYRRILGTYKKIVFHANFLMGAKDTETADIICDTINNYTRQNKYISVLFCDIDDDLLEQLGVIPRCDLNQNRHISANQRPHYYADLSDPASTKKVKKLHKKSRTPDKCDCSPIELKTYRHPHELEDFYDIARKISSSSLKTKKGYPFRETPAWLAKYSQFSKEGSLRCYVLLLEHEPAAYLIAYFHDNVAYFDQSNFSFKYAYYCPGIYLLIKAIESMMEEGNIETIDFGAGQNIFKQRLSTSITNEQDIHIFTSHAFSKFYYHCIIFMENLITLRNRIFPMLRPYYFIKEIKKLFYIKELKNT